MRIARLTILLAAIVVCAWFIVGVRQAHETGEAMKIVSQPQTSHDRAKLRHASSLLASAGVLNPDRAVDILRGWVAIQEQQPRRAERIFMAVTRSEPMNLEGWVWLAGTALIDPPEAQTAVAHIHALDPRNR